jgi:hypothetical protein
MSGKTTHHKLGLIIFKYLKAMLQNMYLKWDPKVGKDVYSNLVTTAAT